MFATERLAVANDSPFCYCKHVVVANACYGSLCRSKIERKKKSGQNPAHLFPSSLSFPFFPFTYAPFPFISLLLPSLPLSASASSISARVPAAPLMSECKGEAEHLVFAVPVSVPYFSLSSLSPSSPPPPSPLLSPSPPSPPSPLLSPSLSRRLPGFSQSFL
jgi:hypothetical protein